MPHTAARAATTLGASPEPRPLGVGDVAAGRYRIIERLGEGAMGCVYACEHVTVGRKVALKVLKPFLGNDDIARRFRTEAKAASAAGHPNIVDVLDAGELDDGRPYIAMEFLAGRTVFDQVQRSGRLPPLRAAAIAGRVARALAAAHAAGVIHRDLKAENVMLASDDLGQEVVKVVDFGIAHGIADPSGRRTREGFVMGTPEYMAPEQAAGDPASAQFDIYAIGVLMYEMVTGVPPFVADTAIEVIVAKSTRDPPSVSTAVDLPRDLAELIDACLHREPAARPRSATEIADRLEVIVQHLRGDEQRETVAAGATAAQLPVATRTWLPWLVLAAAGLVLSLAGWWRFGRSPSGHAAGTAVVVAQAPASMVSDPPPQPAPPVAEPPPARVPSPAPSDTASPAVAEPPAVDPPVDPPVAGPKARASVPRPPVVDEAPDAAVASDDEPAIDCDGVVAGARAARQQQKWAKLLAATDKKSCWDKSERRRMQVLALKELGRFEECVVAGKGAADPETQRWQQLCRRRLEGRAVAPLPSP